MERFRNILFAAAGGKEDGAALDRANRLALSNKARITLVRVVEDMPLAASCFFSKERLAELTAATRAVAQADLDRLVEKLDPAVRAETLVLNGKPFIELIRTVLGQGHDLLIKSGPAVTDSPALAGTDLHLLRKCPCPVWIIKPTQRKPFGKILVAVDPDPTDPERLSLHADLVKLATSLAKNENSKIDVVHIWQLEGESFLRGPRFKMSDEEIDTLSKEVGATHKEWLEELLAPYADLPIKVTLAKGMAGPALIDVIEKKKPDILLMGTVARTGLPGLLIGNTAEFVLGKISCSVLTVKPKNFRTPVS